MWEQFLFWWHTKFHERAGSIIIATYKKDKYQVSEEYCSDCSMAWQYKKE